MSIGGGPWSRPVQLSQVPTLSTSPHCRLRLKYPPDSIFFSRHSNSILPKISGPRIRMDLHSSPNVVYFGNEQYTGYVFLLVFTDQRTIAFRCTIPFRKCGFPAP